MYYAVVATFMFALPLLSVFVEAGTSHAAVGALLACKWFVFWAMGWRAAVLLPSATAALVGS